MLGSREDRIHYVMKELKNSVVVGIPRNINSREFFAVTEVSSIQDISGTDSMEIESLVSEKPMSLREVAEYLVDRDLTNININLIN